VAPPTDLAGVPGAGVYQALLKASAFLVVQYESKIELPVSNFDPYLAINSINNWPENQFMRRLQESPTRMFKTPEEE
jgi:hypothetical protein